MENKTMQRLRAVIITLLLVLFFSVLCIYPFLPNRDSKDRKPDYYTSETKGIVFNISQKKTYSQGITGTKPSTLWYEISYCYEVDGESYYRSDLIKGLSIDDKKFLRYAKDSLNKASFVVRYASSNPEEAFLVKTFD